MKPKAMVNVISSLLHIQKNKTVSNMRISVSRKKINVSGLAFIHTITNIHTNQKHAHERSLLCLQISVVYHTQK